MTDHLKRIHIKREQFKFSAAHMTVFVDGTKEALHGHNYTVELTVDYAGFILFSDFKVLLGEVCARWDERVLIALKCQFLKMHSRDAESTEFHLCGKRYVIPTDEIVGLEVDNVTSESLAEEFSRQLVSLLGEKALLKKIQSLTVRIDESPGQGASFVWTQK